MALAMVFTRAQQGMQSPEVVAEVHASSGLPSFQIVGLPETAVRESRERVRAAIVQAGFEFPARRITVNLAPADLPKAGGRFDLAIAIGVLAASRQVPTDRLIDCEFFGELALSGALRRSPALLPAVLAAHRAGRQAVVPRGCAPEVGLLPSTPALLATHLLDVVRFLRAEQTLEAVAAASPPCAETDTVDLADVRGQHHARRALQITAAGGHNLLLVGPPGTGKTMLAKRLPGLLGELSDAEAVEAGEISLAHHGVLFMDELPEFSRPVLEALREPLESGHISVCRASRSVVFPARFQLVAAMNPCPCGFAGDSQRACRCSPDQIARYQSRVSGPLLDRIDLVVSVRRESADPYAAGRPSGPSTARLRLPVARAIARQLERQGRRNACLEGKALHDTAAPDARGQALLSAAVERLGLSARACDRVLRVARTIADLDGRAVVDSAAVSESLGFRPQRVGVGV